MTRTAYDGVAGDAAAIGSQAKPGDLVGGYGDGIYAWSAADWARIKPGVVRFVIVVFATTNAGVVLDCEPGNATPAEAVDWVLMRRRAGVDPTVYMSVSNWPAVRSAFNARGVAEPHYWVAQYDGKAVIPAGAIGKQYADNNLLGEPWDISVVADYWPGIDPTPNGDDMPLTDADADLILNRELPRQGAGESGPTSLAGMVAWNDAHVQAIVNKLNAIGTALTAPQIDYAKLAAAIVAAPGFATALKAAEPTTFTGKLS